MTSVVRERGEEKFGNYDRLRFFGQKLKTPESREGGWEKLRNYRGEDHSLRQIVGSSDFPT